MLNQLNNIYYEHSGASGLPPFDGVIMKGSDIRSAFLMYFAERGHTVVSSSGLVPHDDPTLLFANAGMNQFKDIFLGKETRDYKRATTCQKVVRAGGKHNDLENVGRTARHHTFFEMLGNFSFGDYFKTDAIKFAWEFLTVKMGIPAERLFVTVFRDDDEAFDIWHDIIGLHSSKIIRMGEKDNFWQMGDTGPCGPCSEIYFDQGPDVGCKRPECDPFCDCDRHLEIWNLVFMQYNRDEKGVLNPLPKPSIDTGMGLERIAAVMQGKQSNYETDLIRPIIEFAAQLASKTYGANANDDVSMRVIADHSRSATFLIADGVLPANEGRGYVLRRIMRRAMRHGRMLGFENEFFYKVCGFVVDFMKEHYIELADKREFIMKAVNTEENAFGKTLSAGMKLINDELLPKAAAAKVMQGEDIFRLYDTHGFPVDLLQDIVDDAGYTLDMVGFEECMAKQQERAKRSGLGVAAVGVADVLKKFGAELKTEFNGYAADSVTSEIKVIVKNASAVELISVGESADIILSVTTFYAEGGGEVGDTGTITLDGNVFVVENTIKVGSAYIHRGRMTKGSLAKGKKVVAAIDSSKRREIERNHTVTHLLHKALQKSVGGHARQAGSMVSHDKLRFDFTHSSALTPNELSLIETEVNKTIFANLAVVKRIEPIQQAMNAGATALFGEKYDDMVRIVEIEKYSMELCGGCHTDRTGAIGLFKIIGEASVASGVRRIEAVTGMYAIKHVEDIETAAYKVALMLKCAPTEIYERVTALQESIKERDRLLREVEEKVTARAAHHLMDNVKEINGVKVLTARLDNATADGMRNFIDSARSKMGSGIVFACGAFEGKVTMVCGVTPDLTSKYKAGQLVKEVAKVVGGSGGGKDDMAQAGGKDISQIDAAIEKIYSLIH